MKKLVLILFLLSNSVYSISPFVEGSLGVNAITDVSEGSRSEDGMGINLNGKGGLMLGQLFGGVDLNFSVLSTEDTYFNRVEENSYGVVGGIDLAGFTRVFLSLYPYSVAEHDNGKYKGMGYKLGGAIYLPFLPEANILLEFRNISYDKKKVGGSYQSVPDLEVSSLSVSFGIFFGG